MQNFEKHRKKYEERIKRFIDYLKKIDPKWINKRDWFQDLKEFKLGQNFFEEVLFGDELHIKEKEEFYTKTLIFASVNIAKKVGIEKDHFESGFVVEQNIFTPGEEREHEVLLGYLWWIAIYHRACQKMDPHQRLELKIMRKKFMEQIERIQSL